MTNQNVFDQVAVHAMSQMEKSQESDNFRCLYRDEGGRKCFVGALIPDEIYEVDMEDLPVDDLIEEYSTVRALLQGVTPDLLRVLQNVHDADSVDQWHNGLMKTAATFNLSTKALTEVTKND